MVALMLSSGKKFLNGLENCLKAHLYNLIKPYIITWDSSQFNQSLQQNQRTTFVLDAQMLLNPRIHLMQSVRKMMTY